ncbi:MAG: DUF4416 family protein [Phycisphaerae bacterium]
MAQANRPPEVKLICGMISADRELFEEARAAMTRVFGPEDLVSEVMDFDFTHYYDTEMGSPLYRRFVSFARRVQPDALVEAKWLTNALECDFATRRGGHPARPINLDPGYIENAKLVLASMKNFSHRVYLGKSVFGEVTLTYHKDGWKGFPWTFPDFASGRYDPFLLGARECLRAAGGEANS